MLMRSFVIKSVLVTLLAGICGGLPAMVQADVALVQNGAARAVIYVMPEVMAEGKSEHERLRESVKDLALYLQKMSGAQVEVLTTPPAAGEARLPILIGDLAVKAFGPPAKKSPYGQGWRMVVSPKGVGLMGESGEATSYAIYEVLDRLGCRWYIPSEMGEVIPSKKDIVLPELDISEVPATISRNIWYGDQAFRRRNRQGGFFLTAGHALEVHSGDRYGYLTKQQLEEHPEWNAMIGGKRSINGRFCWGNPEVSTAVADSIINILDKQYTPTISLSPEDGATFCECPLDKALDAGDWDPTMGQVSITDRYVNFCNRVAERVTKKHPNVLFGFLAYVQYTRAPVREKLHPNLVPQIAPITYCRAHAMTDACPSRSAIRPIVEGWGKRAALVAYYNYMFHLAEVAVPYPMMHQMSEELPILYGNNVKLWTPETMANFESVLPGYYLTIRKSWYTKAPSSEVLDEFFTRFYGAAATPMRRYWQTMDDAWTNVPEHAGSGFGYMRRFTPPTMRAAREAIDAALAAAKNPVEQQRVKMQDDSLRQFELFMKLRRDLAEGQLANLASGGEQWVATQKALADKYAPQSAFGKVNDTTNYSIIYLTGQFQPAYVDASRIARDFNVISPSLREWRYMVDKDKKGERAGWQKPNTNDTAWKSTDVAVETWAALGLMDYYGSMWYRKTVKVPQVPAGKKVYLWLSSTDGSAKVFVNGRHIPYVNAKGEKNDEFSGYTTPASFDVTGAIQPNADNQITIIGTRIPPVPNELGTGGLLGPVLLYQEK